MTLAWVWCMVRYLRMHRRRDVVLAAACLAAGIYIYAAALVITPIYFALTSFSSYDSGTPRYEATFWPRAPSSGSCCCR